MNAKELYTQSLKGNRSHFHHIIDGLPTKIYNNLFRAKCVDGEHGEPLNKKKVEALILSGKIWDLRNVGAKTVQAVCAWLTNSANNKN